MLDITTITRIDIASVVGYYADAKDDYYSKDSSFTAWHGQGAEALGLSPENSTQALKAMLERFHLPTSYPELDEQAIYTAITHDKKARGSQLKIITLKEIGQAQITPIPIENIKEYIKGEN